MEVTETKQLRADGAAKPSTSKAEEMGDGEWGWCLEEEDKPTDDSPHPSAQPTVEPEVEEAGVEAGAETSENKPSKPMTASSSKLSSAGLQGISSSPSFQVCNTAI
jgi:hypothetical protein